MPQLGFISRKKRAPEESMRTSILPATQRIAVQCNPVYSIQATT